MARDHLLRALLQDRDLRLLVCDATAAAQHASHLQGCDRTTAPLFAEAIVGVLLAAGLGKDHQRVTLQLAGAGPMRGLFTDGTAEGAVRGYVRSAKIEEALPGPPDLTTAVGPSGYLSVLRELPDGDVYRAAVELAHPRLDRNLERYYADSEQIPTAVAIEVRADDEGRILRAVGIVVQRLPGGDTEALEEIRRRMHAGGLAIPGDGDTGGARLALPLVDGLGELEVLEDVPVFYRCSCSRERAYRGVASAGRDEILDMVARDHGAEVNCEFCKTVYRFDAADLLALLDELITDEN